MQNGVPGFSLLEKEATMRRILQEQEERLELLSAMSPVPASVPQHAAPPNMLKSQLLCTRMTEPARNRALKIQGTGVVSGYDPTVPQMARGDLQPHKTVKYRYHNSSSAGKGI